jgi:hypothetical protein
MGAMGAMGMGADGGDSVAEMIRDGGAGAAPGVGEIRQGVGS